MKIEKYKIQTANTLDEASVAKRLSASYREVGENQVKFVESMVRFGTELVEWARYLGEGRGSGESEGLKTWLADNCPDINYKTAMGYKRMAAEAIRMLGGGAHATAALLGEGRVATPAGDVIDVDAKVLERKAQLFEEATSRRKLEQMYFEFERAAKGEKAGAKGAEYAVVRRSPVENAVRIVWPTIQPYLKHRGAVKSALKLLPAEKLAEARQTIEEYLAMLDAEIKSRKM